METGERCPFYRKGGTTERWSRCGGVLRASAKRQTLVTMLNIEYRGTPSQIHFEAIMWGYFELVPNYVVEITNGTDNTVKHITCCNAVTIYLYVRAMFFRISSS